MIELISDSRCIECNLCVKVCPTNVFDEVENSVPVIARPDDCQTCFMCESQCPVDALYVAPNVDFHVAVTEKELEEKGFFGNFRANWGIGPGRTPNSQRQRGGGFGGRRGGAGGGGRPGGPGGPQPNAAPTFTG